MPRIIGIAGSLRARSLNRALLNAAVQLAPDGMEIEVADLSTVPLFNQDMDVDGQRPDGVERLKLAVREADAVLIATPEYSFAMPGVLKNALDWLARPGHGLGRPMTGKMTGIMGASPGGGGSMRAQEHLKLSLIAMRALIYPHGGVAVGRAGDKFDSDLNLSDERTRDFLAKYLDGFAAWIDR